MKEHKRPANKGSYKKMKLDNNLGNENNDEFTSNKIDIDRLISREQSSTPLQIRSNIYIGINEVTKHLERMTSSQVHSKFNYHHLISANPNDQLTTLSCDNTSLISQTRRQHHSSLEMIFVCKADLLSQLYSHFPMLCNIAGDVLLVPLP